VIDMKADAESDAFVRRQIAAGRKFVPISDAPWIASLETTLPLRLPPSFRSLILRYRFGPFRASGIAFFGNRGDNDRDDLVVGSLSDPVLARVSQQHGFVQVGRPDTGTYDPVCFDMRRRSKDGEAPLVCLDHEEILIHGRIRVVRQCAKSFAEAIGEKRPA
jgi:hypothetical protein